MMRVMRDTVMYGVMLGLLVTVWALVMGMTGWYLDPVLQALFFMVVPIEIAVVVALLYRTRQTNGYVKQLRNGSLVGVIAAPIVFLQSIVFTLVLFPTYFADLRAMQEAMLLEEGRSADQIARELEAAAAMQNPVMNAVSGSIATILTAVVVSAIAAIFLRRRGDAPAPART
jgi:hypothetical protein